ncbi:heavy metal translocating P-type ATPase [Actibacterium ureilyticum]|uniref:heavy metal translocating P-type ATPase n=1 Tax=Actibacterium ureilyticum TaxID=1590614 RepID=UPI000BAAAF2F|nr:heavy metal translocating P-type ATPase [Actibacterium ureilyticum]
MTQMLSFPVTGLSCASCVGRAQKALQAVPGVSEVSLNLASQKAQVQIADGASAGALAEALDGAGYPAAMAEGKLAVQGMNCGSCVAKIEKILLAQPGVVSATANLAGKTAQVRWLSGTQRLADLAAALTAGGYDAQPAGDTPPEAVEDAHAAEISTLRRSTLWAVVLALPVFVLAMGAHLVPGMAELIGRTIGHKASWLIQGVLTTALLAGPGRVFYRKGIPALLRGSPEMNSLVALGTLAAWSYSTLVLLVPGLFPAGTAQVYYEAAAVVAALILVGRWLEARAKGRTGAAIAALVRLQPATAMVERNGTFAERPLDEIVTGDIIQLRPGERIAVDGTVVEGTSYVDESMITGEPMPVAKDAGAKVIGGTVNGQGALRLRATAVGGDTVLSQIIRMVETAQAAKLPIQALLDRITSVFVPVVIAVALATVLVWLVFGPDPRLALVAGVSVLIVACPCAMGLATPTSIMVGTGRAAELGVLFRKGEALQQMQKAAVIAFDKTGTLTMGQPVLASFEAVAPGEADAVLARLAGLESASEHPVGRAIVAAARDKGAGIPQASEVQITPGHGLQGMVDGHEIRAGSARHLTGAGIDLAPVSDAGHAIAARGETPVYVAEDGRAVAVLGVADRVKPGAEAVIAGFRDQGVQVAMITGDTAETAARIGQQIGIDAIEAEVLPGDKAEAVKRLRTAHGPVIFVGDGINDAPALAEADTGIAIGTGTDVAIEAADIVLMTGDLAGTLTAYDISRATMRNIRQNLFWAFAYNVALIPVAAGALHLFGGPLLSPMLAGGAMALSSVFVVTNALRLRRAGGGKAAQQASGWVPATAEQGAA